MEDDPSIANFSLYPNEFAKEESEKYSEFGKLKKDTPYLMNCQVAIWRKTTLMEIIRQKESPWAFEDNGTARAAKSKYDFYAYVTHHLSEVKPIFHYYLGLTHGYGVWHGKWLWKDKELFESFNIKADFTKRASWENWDDVQREINLSKNPTNKKYSIIKRIARKILR